MAKFDKDLELAKLAATMRKDVGFFPRGEWKSELTYMPTDVVFYEDNAYIALRKTKGELPTDKEFFMLFARGGKDGEELELKVIKDAVCWKQKSETEWTRLIGLDSLIGKKGERGFPGVQGIEGKPGKDGKDGKQVELRKTKTHVQWRLTGGEWINLILIAELVGPQGKKGDKGDPGDSAYEIWLRNGHTGTEQQFLASLRGAAQIISRGGGGGGGTGGFQTAAQTSFDDTIVAAASSGAITGSNVQTLLDNMVVGLISTFASIFATIGALGSPEQYSRTITKVAHGLTAKNWYREEGGSDSGSGVYVPAQADTEAHAKGLLGVTNIVDADTFVLIMGGYDTGYSGLTPSTMYYLSTTAPGGLQDTRPTGVGEVIMPVFYAVGATRGIVNISFDYEVIGDNLKSSQLDTDVNLAANSDAKIATQKATKAYVDANAGGSPTWGSITGTLGSQSDLQTALDNKLDDVQLDTDGTLAANSDAKIASQKATKTYADTKTTLAAVNAQKLSVFATTTSAELAGVISNETGTGALVFADSPALTTSPTAPTQTAGDSSTKLATTAFVQTAVLQGISKEAVKYASIAALPSIVYANGASGVGATLTGVALAAISLDSGSPAVNDRVLIKNQVSTFQNGIYTVTATGSGIAVFVLTRTIDFDQASDIKTGDSILVTAGTTLPNTTWGVNSADSPVMGTDAITFVQTAGPGSVTSGNGITVTGASVAINTSVTVDKTTAQTLTNKTMTSPIVDTGISGSAIDTDSTMAANSDTLLASQKATKTAIATKQPLDSDLTTIAGLTATTGNFLVSQASAWTSRTPANVKADLGIPLDTLGQYKGTTADYWAIQKFSTVATSALTSGRAYYSPVYVGKSTGVDRVGVTITASTAGALSTIELGLYNDTSGRPGSLVDSYGTVSATGVASVEITISKTLAVGWYWVAILPVLTSGAVTLRTMSGAVNLAPSTTLATSQGANNYGWIQSSLTTLPNPAVAAAESAIQPIISYRLT